MTLVRCAVFAALAACAHVSTGPAMKPTVVIAQRIHTLDPARPAAQALVFRGGTLSFVGSERDALFNGGPSATVLRYPDATIVPGLIDAHVHLASLGRSLAIVDLGPAQSEAEAVRRLSGASPESYEGDWLRGRGWDQNDWASATFPSKASLDAQFPSTPVYLTRIDGHAAWVNSEALRRAGITSTTANPAGGRIERAADGAPTGLLIDNAMNLVEAKLPKPTDAVAEARLRRAVDLCLSLGLTQVHDAGMDLATFRQLARWARSGALPLRVYAMADGQGDEADFFLQQGLVTDLPHLELRAVKLLADGALGSRGAALKSPYSDAPGETGLLLLTSSALSERARAFARRGFQVAVHAIGDRANELVLDVLSTLPPAGRHRVEHAQVLSPADVPRFAAHGLIASFQPTHATSDMPWAEQRLGPERARGAYAWRAVIDTGAHVAFGSDFPVEHPNPLWGLYAARTRQDHAGAPASGWYPSQRLTALEALAGFTTGAAYASFAEGRRGKLTVGFDADFVVLPVDPIDAPAAALLTAKVRATVVDGQLVFDSSAR